MHDTRAVWSLIVAALVSLPATLPAAIIPVTSTADSGAGTLRDAIDVSNASAGELDTITFNIAGAGVHTITVSTDLPAITDPVVIDGTTQPGFSGSPLIELAPASGLSWGIRVTAGDSTIRGLVIHGFGANVRLDTSGGNLVEGCYLGTDPTGTVGSQGNGVYIQNSDDNTIGGTAASARNLISGHNGNAIQVFTSDGTIIQGNLIGTTADGLGALANSEGITLAGATNTLVGGSAAGARNLISSNGNGVYLSTAGDGNRIQGNWMGTDITGTQPLSNNFAIDANNLTGTLVIGGPAPGEGNLISGNNQAILLNNGVHSAVVKGNLIGTDASGVLPLPNNGAILLNTLDTTDILIGGPAPGEGNVIAFNRGTRPPGFPGGIWNLGVRITIRGNSMHDNFGIAIDNSDGSLGINPNDPGDPDTGANEFQNFPIPTSVEILGPEGLGTRIQGVLHSAPSTTYTLDFYANPACSNFPREFLQGETYLGFGQTTTDGSGTAVFDITLPAQIEPGARISATATDPAGNTSEFSQRIVFSILPTAGPASGGTAVTLAGTDFGSNAAVTIGGVAATDVNVVSTTQITAVTPLLAAGTVNDVTVSNTDGSAGTLSKGFVADFLDVPPQQQFYAFVTTLVSNAITVGIGGGLYGVDQPTLRQQMAVFLLKSKYGLCYQPPPCTVPIFTDVPCSSNFAPWINELVAQGITGGCGAGTTYCPSDPVLRQQMAVLLLRTFEGAGYAPPACTAATFADVPCSSPFAPWIYELVARNITAGCGGGNYCPSLSANRGQMATFLVRTFSLQ